MRGRMEGGEKSARQSSEQVLGAGKLRKALRQKVAIKKESGLD